MVHLILYKMKSKIGVSQPSVPRNSSLLLIVSCLQVPNLLLKGVVLLHLFAQVPLQR